MHVMQFLDKLRFWRKQRRAAFGECAISVIGLAVCGQEHAASGAQLAARGRLARFQLCNRIAFLIPAQNKVKAGQGKDRLKQKGIRGVRPRCLDVRV